MTPSARRLAVLVGLPLLYAAAVGVGRGTVLPGGDLGLVWPAAGVGFVWWHAAGPGRARVLTLAALLLLGWAVTDGTTASTVESFALAAGAATQVAVAGLVYGRQARPPALLATRAEQFWWLVGAAIGASVVSLPFTVWAAAAAGREWTVGVAALWVVRNAVSVVVIVPLVGALLNDGHRWFPARTRDTPVRLTVVEHALVLVLAPSAYALWFTSLTAFPLAFPLIALTIWAGSRLETRFVVLHNTAMGATAVALTLLGVGPFAGLGDSTVRVTVAYLYVGMVAVIGTVLALARAERLRLLAATQAARDESARRAALLATILDTMDEGVGVVGRDGTVLLRNRRATELLGGRHAGADVTLLHADGRRVADGEMPHGLVAPGDGRDVDLRVRQDGAGAERYVRLSSARLPDGAGVVSTMRDVTVERTEAAHAAAVQNALLPDAPPEMDGFDLAATSRPAGTLGGDFYDWQRTDDGLVLTIADVMGKGAPAALLAAATRTALRGQAGLRDSGAALASTEQAVHGDLVRSGAFVTAFRAHVDRSSGAVTYADAGHGLSFVVRHGGGVDRLTGAQGLPLGVAPEVPRSCESVQLQPQDVLVMLSDGVLDALHGGLDALDRVADVVRGTSGAADAVDAVLRLTADAPDVDYADDRTVLALVAR